MSTAQLRRKIKLFAEELPATALKDAVRSLSQLQRSTNAQKPLTREQKAQRLRRAIAKAEKEGREGKLVPWEEVRRKYQ